MQGLPESHQLLLKESALGELAMKKLAKSLKSAASVQTKAMKRGIEQESIAASQSSTPWYVTWPQGDREEEVKAQATGF